MILILAYIQRGYYSEFKLIEVEEKFLISDLRNLIIVQILRVI